MSKATVKDSKAHIIETFQQILRERQKVASKVATKEEEAEKDEDSAVEDSDLIDDSDEDSDGLDPED